jgi:large subunit ribosomal protein L10
LAFSKKHKNELIAQYEQWLKDSQAVFVVNYSKMSMKEIDTLRAKVRETGSEIHVVKNTLVARAFEAYGIKDAKFLEGSSLMGFAFTDPPALAKVLSESTNKSDVFVLKGGYLGFEELEVAQIKALAELPPLPVMRATLLGVIMAPASKLVRTLAEPARSMAAVIKGYSEKEATPVAE